MGYRIIYGKKKRACHQLGRARWILVFVIIIAGLIAAGMINLRLSGFALENMAQAVRDGQKVSDAIVTFCREIIENGQVIQ